MGRSMLDTNTRRKEQVIAMQEQRRKRAAKNCSILKSRIDNIIALKKASSNIEDSLHILSADAANGLYVLTMRAEAAIKDIQADLLQEINSRKIER